MNQYTRQDLVALAFSVIKIKFGLSSFFFQVLFHFMAFCLNSKTYLLLVFLNPFLPTLMCQRFKDYHQELLANKYAPPPPTQKKKTTLST